MPTGPELPTQATVAAIARDFGLDLSPEDIATYQSMMKGLLPTYRKLEELPERKPPVKYPRDAGWRPTPEDNPLNGWYWRCNVEGAAAGPLKGKRIALKDVVCLAGIPMMNGSRVLEGYVPDIDATVVTRILDAGGTIVGKSNSEDFSFSAGGHTCSHGPVGNPYDPTRNPGASSNGNVVVLATGQVDMAIGGDQGGSIRTPASWSGCYGLKPTFGLVPYTGCVGIEPTVDHVGPMANSTEDIARLLDVVAGPDGFDPRQAGAPKDFQRGYLEALSRGVRGLKIGVIKEGFGQDGIDSGFPPAEEIVDQKVHAAIGLLRSLGATVEEVSIPWHLDALHIFYALLMEGATETTYRGRGTGVGWKGWYNTGLSEFLGRGYKARPNDLPSTVISTILFGEYLHRNYLGRYYGKAQNLRHLVVDAYEKALSDYDVLATPTNAFRATPMVNRDASLLDTNGTALNNIRNTLPANLTGHPSISIPCGMGDGLPIGLMLTGRYYNEATLIAASAAFERLGDWKAL